MLFVNAQYPQKINYSLWFSRHSLFPLNTNLPLRKSRYYSETDQNKRGAEIIGIKVEIDVNSEFDIVNRLSKIIDI